MSEQGSQEWLVERLGLFTGSLADRIMGGPAAQKTLILEKAGEILSGKPAREFRGNAATERGHRLEPEAAGLYSISHGVELLETGLVYWDQSPLIAASPDRMVDPEGGVEIKCLGATDHLRALIDGPDKKYVHQINWCLMVTGEPWWDYVGYNPDLPPEVGYYEKRYERDEKVMKKYEDAAWSFIERLNEVFKKIGVEI